MLKYTCTVMTSSHPSSDELNQLCIISFTLPLGVCFDNIHEHKTDIRTKMLFRSTSNCPVTSCTQRYTAIYVWQDGHLDCAFCMCHFADKIKCNFLEAISFFHCKMYCMNIVCCGRMNWGNEKTYTHRLVISTAANNYNQKFIPSENDYYYNNHL